MEFSQEAYELRLQELFRKFPSVQKDGFASGAYKAGLEGMRRLDAILGRPHESYPTVHVAGTNGKGSVSSMIAASLAASGFRVGLYTSPHLVDFRERIKLLDLQLRSIRNNGAEMIGKEAVWEFLERFDRELEGLSFFEITTGMALWWFREQEVDIAVIEVGLGGMLDSTNIITPLASVVTSIGLDHCSLLGSTRPLIAEQKAGIFKPGVPAVVGCCDDEIRPVFEKTARRLPCPLLSSEGSAARAGLDASELDLRGEYQKENLDTAVCALQAAGLPVCPEGIANAAALTGFHGRWEILREEPLTIADIGHNPAALKLNFAQLEKEASGRPLTIVYGIMADKDLDSIIPMMPFGAHYILCAPDSARALPAGKLQERILAARPGLDTETASSVTLAVKKARETAGTKGVVYIGGSAFVVAEALRDNLQENI